MEISAWINLSLAIVALIGVGVALFIGIRSIRESRNLQIIRYKIELLDKISDWLVNVQACSTEDYLPEDFYSLKQYSLSLKTTISLNLHKRGNASAKVLEEGRNMLGIASFFSQDLCKAVKSLEEVLQKTYEVFIKYRVIIDDTSSDNDLTKVLTELNKKHMNNLKSIHESTAQLISKIFTTRISLFDSISFGLDPFKDVK